MYCPCFIYRKYIVLTGATCSLMSPGHQRTGSSEPVRCLYHELKFYKLTFSDIIRNVKPLYIYIYISGIPFETGIAPEKIVQNEMLLQV